jgi:hypothetical protein
VRLALLATAALCAVAPLPDGLAQNRPNLNGTWVLQVDRSDFGPMPPYTSRTDVFDHREPALTITRTVVSPAGEITTKLVLAVDGKPHQNRAGESAITSTLRWEGTTLVMVTAASTPEGDVTYQDRFTLSADGTTLTQVRTIRAGGEEASQTMVFARR